MGLGLPPVIGHRGAAGLAPENTLAGFRAAAAAGARWVEFDVKLTGDGNVVLMHDDRLDRTTDGRGPVATAAFSTIAALDAGAWFGEGFEGERVPSLEQAMVELARLGLGANIEIKPNPGQAADTARAVVDLLVARWPDDLPAPLLSSFDQACLAVARDRAPALPRGYLAEALPFGWRRDVEALGCVSVNLGHRQLSARHVDEVLAAGLALVIWTVNEPTEAARLWAAGVTSIITDRPNLIATTI